MQSLNSLMKYMDKIVNEREKEMSDKVTSYVRTYSPIIVGALLAWLATKGITVDGDFQNALIVIITASLQGLYYALARLVGKKYPEVEKWLLGSSKTPSYK